MLSGTAFEPGRMFVLKIQNAMNKLKSLYIACGLTALMTTSCSKDSNGPSGSDFSPSDFELTITNTEIDNNAHQVEVDYTVKNVSNRNYTFSSESNMHVKFTVKATDGTTFMDTNIISECDAGTTDIGSDHIAFTPGKTIDMSTFTYQVYDQQ